MNQYREVGVSLGVFLRSQKPSVRQIQAYVADLVVNEELLVPLKEVVSRAGFVVLRDLAGTGRGRVEKLSFVRDIRKTYASSVADQIEAVLDGMLGLGERTAQKRLRQKWIPVLIAMLAMPGLAFFGFRSLNLPMKLSVSRSDRVGADIDTKPEERVMPQVVSDISTPSVENKKGISSYAEEDEVLASELISRCKGSMHLLKQLDSRQELYMEAFYEELGLFWSHVRGLGLQKAGTPIHALLDHMNSFPTVKAYYMADIEKAKISSRVLDPYFAGFDTTEQIHYKLEAWLKSCDSPPAKMIIKQWREGEVTYPFVKRS